MAFRFVALVAALAFVNIASANPRAYHHAAPVIAAPAPCARPALPAIQPTVVQSVVPGPVNIGPEPVGVIEHASAPYEINYFGKPWVVKHQQSAALNVFAQTPVVVDEYAAPSFNEALAPPAVIVEQVYGAPVAAVPGAGYAYGANYGYGQGYGHGYAAPVASYGCH